MFMLLLIFQTVLRELAEGQVGMEESHCNVYSVFGSWAETSRLLHFSFGGYPCQHWQLPNFWFYVFDFMHFCFVVHDFWKRQPMSNKETCWYYFCCIDLCETPSVLSIICQQYCMRSIINGNILINCLCMVAKCYGWVTADVSFHIVTILFSFVLYWWCQFHNFIRTIYFPMFSKSNCSVSRLFDCPQITMMWNTLMATQITGNSTVCSTTFSG